MRGLFEAQAVLIQALESGIQAREDQLAKNSRNSSKPASSAGLKKPNPKSRRQKSGKSSGGQHGDVGYRLEPVDKADHIEVHPVLECQGGPADWGGVEARKVEKCQVVDLPEVNREVTEHQAEIKTCPVGGAIDRAAFPQDITPPTPDGPRGRGQLV